jgi:hypothetical protein
MLTYTGETLYPLNPDIDKIKIEDIAHALSLLVRANGHVKHFYSVAQHSLNCLNEAQARGYCKKIQLACLLHDASEAYIADIIHPIKQELTRYIDIENKLQNIIHFLYKVELTPEESLMVKEIDEDLLWHEFMSLMAVDTNKPLPKIFSVPDFSEHRYVDIEKNFLQQFLSLTE